MLATDTDRPSAGMAFATRLNFSSGRWLRASLRGGAIGLLLALAVEAFRVLVGSNFHTVIPGRVYRSAQPTDQELEQLTRKFGIRTVLNLRGCCDGAPFYLEECRATHRLDLAQEDLCLSAGRLPSVDEIRRLVEIVERSEYPLLIHCKRGADRTGLVAAAILLLTKPMSVATARQQLGLRYGHLALGRPAYLDRFLELYADWLAAQGRTHSPADFRQWLVNGYVPGECRTEIEMLDRPEVHPGTPSALRVRFHNTGVTTWRFRPGNNAGIHAGFTIWDEQDRLVGQGRAGLFHAEVPPGRAIDLTLALPALPRAGRYRFFVDLNDEQQCWFHQTGSEPWEGILDVH